MLVSQRNRRAICDCNLSLENNSPVKATEETNRWYGRARKETKRKRAKYFQITGYNEKARRTHRDGYREREKKKKKKRDKSTILCWSNV